ncbi:MAG: diguanylate cyclase [Bacillota bacterium]
MMLAEHEMEMTRKTNEPLCLVFCDVDGLKSINDNFGHNEGDAALKYLATGRTINSNRRVK